MIRIIRIGMDVHSTNYTLCNGAVLGGEDRIYANIQVTPDYKNIILFIEDLKLKLGLNEKYDILCGYEAGCLGYSLYNQLTNAGIRCEILRFREYIIDNKVWHHGQNLTGLLILCSLEEKISF